MRTFGWFEDQHFSHSGPMRSNLESCQKSVIALVCPTFACPQTSISAPLSSLHRVHDYDFRRTQSEMEEGENIICQ